LEVIAAKNSDLIGTIYFWRTRRFLFLRSSR